MSYVPIVEVLLAGRDLSPEQARDLMAAMLSDEVSDSVKGAALGLLRRKGATGQELAAFAQVLREHAITMQSSVENLVDTCGTGGGIPSFNLSTAAALIAAGAGAKVAKHGNRAVTSTCGSADVLEALGVRILDDPCRLNQIISDVGIAFLFAPGHHPTMKKVGPIRRELGFKTVFNQLGPLANPFGARRQVIGVYQADLVRPMAEALALLGAEHALTVHGMDGLDEISPCGPTLCAEVIGGKVREFEFEPADFGLEPLPASALACGNSHEEGAAILREAISVVASPRALACLPNAAAALVVSGVAGNWKEGALIAKEAISSGAAVAKLEALIASTGTEGLEARG